VPDSPVTGTPRDTSMANFNGGVCCGQWSRHSAAMLLAAVAVLADRADARVRSAPSMATGKSAAIRRPARKASNAR